MIQISNALKTHLQQDVTTLCTLCLITRQDSKQYGFTDFSDDIVFNGVTFVSGSGQVPMAVKTTSALNVDNTEIITVLSDSTFTESDVNSGLWDFATVKLSKINYKDLTMGQIILMSGTIGQVKIGRNMVTAELRSITQAMQQNIGRIYSNNCSADFCDPKCGLVIGNFTFTGSVTSQISSISWIDSSLSSFNANYFRGGIITWTSGLNNGFKTEIRGSISGFITLQLSMINQINIGDTYSIIAGCDKTIGTCSGIFNNQINFRGFPHVPGQDALISGG